MQASPPIASALWGEAADAEAAEHGWAEGMAASIPCTSPCVGAETHGAHGVGDKGCSVFARGDGQNSGRRQGELP